MKKWEEGNTRWHNRSNDTMLLRQ